MTGRIKSPTSLGVSEFMAAENRLPVPPPHGVSVPDARPALAAEKRAKGSYLQYLGFTHDGNVRIYRFRRVARGEEAREFIVNVDLALFAKHHVSLQEGPALSLQRLSSEAIDPAGTPPLQWLTDVEMLAYVAARPDRGAAGRRAKAGLPTTSTADRF
jgi:hypothetical protein